MTEFFPSLTGRRREAPFLPVDEPVFARDAAGRLFKITRLCEMDPDTVYFVAEVIRGEGENG
jgi:hypothetical protein